jgi:hypothetical protein
MKKNVTSILVLAGAAVALVACSGIRVVKASKAGGEIALIGNREEAMELAKTEMGKTCGGPDKYEVIEEGEAVVGAVTNESGSANRNVFGGVSMHGQSETTQKTEWRVKYGCKGVAQPAPAGSGAAPPAAGGGTPSSQIHELVIRD